MPPPSHMERRSIDVSHATPFFCTDEVILLPRAVSSISLCISHLCFGRCSPKLLRPCENTQGHNEKFAQDISPPSHISQKRLCHETDSPFARHNVALLFIPERFRGDRPFLCLLDHTDSAGEW